MRSSLRAELERLGPVKDVAQVHSGSPVVLTISLHDVRDFQSISAIESIARRGVPLAKAKRFVEMVMEFGKGTILVPLVESREAFFSELEGFGFLSASVAAENVDLRSLRARLGLTQEQFALQYGLELDAVRNWEHGRRKPDKAARSYLKVIDRMPEETRAALIDER